MPLKKTGFPVQSTNSFSSLGLLLKTGAHESQHNNNGLTSHKKILPYFQKLLGRNPEWEWNVQKVFPTKNGFVLKWRAKIPVGSRILVEEGMDIVEVMSEKITRNEVYFDRTSWLKAIRENK